MTFETEERFETAERPRVLHILPVLGVAGAEQMATSLMVPLSRKFAVGALGLYPASGTVTETALRREGIPIWTLNKHVGPDPRMFAAVDRVVRSFQPDIIHTHLHVLRYLLPAVIWRKVQVGVHTVHNVAERESDTLGRLIQRFAFKRWTVPVAVSRNVASSLTRVYGIRDAVTIPNGISVRDFHGAPCRKRWREAQGFDQDSVLLIATGRLATQKNPLLLVRAFAALRDLRANLVFVGDGPLKGEVEQEARKLGVGEVVHFLGYRTDVRECLAASDIFVLSSDWEGHPLAVMEAMASGLPVIATNVGGVPELVEEGRHGFLVPPGDAGALGRAMHLLVERADLRRIMGYASRERAHSEFSVDRMVEAYENLYMTLLSAKNPDARRPELRNCGVAHS